MKGWSALHHQAAGKLMDELDRLDPGNVTLAFCRSIFNAARDDGARPSRRRQTSAAELKRIRKAERAADRARLDHAIGDLYLAGNSLIAVGARMGVGQTRVSDALARLHIPTRKQGAQLGTGVDMARVERIRTARESHQSLDQISKAEGISRERVRQICAAHGIVTERAA